MKRFLLSFFFAVNVWAQLVSPQQIPRTTKPPVIFVNGYQADCRTTTFSGSFGVADQVLQQNGQPVVWFNNCIVPNRPTIEQIGVEFGRFIDALRYADGNPVPQVDVVAHSMGGLIVRSYLAGRQPDGSFLPPADPRIRKLVFLSAPHAGSALAPIFIGTGNDAQLQALSPGSQLVFDLATWNQGTEDFRGIDVLSLVGNAGAGFPGVSAPRSTDGAVPVLSASVESWLPGRTRVLVNYCHIRNALICGANALGIALITGETHDTARALISFFNGTSAWQSIGESPSTNEFLANTTGLTFQWRDSRNQLFTMTSAEIADVGKLSLRGNVTAFGDFLPVRQHRITASFSDGATGSTNFEPRRGGTSYVTFKTGPFIAAAVPAAQNVFPRAVAPGMFVSVYGFNLSAQQAPVASDSYPTELAGTQVRIGTRALPLQYVSPGQVNTIMPDDVSGLIRLTVANGTGEHAINVLVEPAVPALFAPAINASAGSIVSADSPLRGGDFVSLFLTGLGGTEDRGDSLHWAVRQPVVTIEGVPCPVSYAGRAPGYVGLDQINCQVPGGLSSNPSARVVVQVGNRTTTSTLPLR